MALRSTGVIVVALLVVTGLSACARRSDPVSALVPRSWTLTAKSGHIAHGCFGSWEECGTLTHSYRTHARATRASEAIGRQLRSKGWTIERTKDDGSQLSARDAPNLDDESARVDIALGNDTATVRYVHS